MNLWTAIVIIVAIWGVVQVMSSRRSGSVRQHDGIGDLPEGDPAREAALQREVEQLRERLEVLERIATDDREAKRLSAEIENLRDER